MSHIWHFCYDMVLGVPHPVRNATILTILKLLEQLSQSGTPQFDIWPILAKSCSCIPQLPRNATRLTSFDQKVIPAHLSHAGTPRFWPYMPSLFLTHLSHLIAPSFGHYWQNVMLGASQSPWNATMSTIMANSGSLKSQKPKNKTIMTILTRFRS